MTRVVGILRNDKTVIQTIFSDNCANRNNWKPIVAIQDVQDAMPPWPPAVKLIAQERSGYIPIAAGIAATGSTITQVSYILIPKRFTSPAILTVNQAENGKNNNG